MYRPYSDVRPSQLRSSADLKKICTAGLVVSKPVYNAGTGDFKFQLLDPSTADSPPVKVHLNIAHYEQFHPPNLQQNDVVLLVGNNYSGGTIFSAPRSSMYIWYISTADFSKQRNLKAAENYRYQKFPELREGTHDWKILTNVCKEAEQFGLRDFSEWKLKETKSESTTPPPLMADYPKKTLEDIDSMLKVRNPTPQVEVTITVEHLNGFNIYGTDHSNHCNQYIFKLFGSKEKDIDRISVGCRLRIQGVAFKMSQNRVFGNIRDGCFITVLPADEVPSSTKRTSEGESSKRIGPVKVPRIVNEPVTKHKPTLLGSKSEMIDFNLDQELQSGTLRSMYDQFLLIKNSSMQFHVRVRICSTHPQFYRDWINDKNEVCFTLFVNDGSIAKDVPIYFDEIHGLAFLNFRQREEITPKAIMERMNVIKNEWVDLGVQIVSALEDSIIGYQITGFGAQIKMIHD
ncbi:hypothetical protein TRVA0_001S01508 [Trichomonascus vanleenenianus]|uniref:uncharacterized protein n=1 Tax=Trichomonascus vanleenenianus TaxID=2268995 RepID=UPI003ECAB033